jgi:hypothetical protein
LVWSGKPLAEHGAQMTETGLPTYLNRGVFLSKDQLRTELGAELLSLCQSVTADGRVAPEEIAGLKQWLSDAEAADMLPAKYLRTVIDRVLADGKITADEYKEVYRAVEAVLPVEVRQQAVVARREAEAADKAAARAEREAARRRTREEPSSSAPVLSVNFMVAGVRHEGRPAIIEQQASAGDPVALERDPDEPRRQPYDHREARERRADRSGARGRIPAACPPPRPGLPIRSAHQQDPDWRQKSDPGRAG